MKQLLITLALFTSCFASAAQQRCGWLENPSPANIWFTDVQGTWFITTQGGQDMLDHKSLTHVLRAMSNEREFVRSVENYGFSCACLHAAVDVENEVITAVYNAKQMSLKQCLENKSINFLIPVRNED